MAEKMISVPVWAKTPSGAVRRGSLAPSHPLSTYSYIKSFGLDPSEYGVSSTVPYDCQGEVTPFDG